MEGSEGRIAAETGGRRDTVVLSCLYQEDRKGAREGLVVAQTWNRNQQTEQKRRSVSRDPWNQRSAPEGYSGTGRVDRRNPKAKQMQRNRRRVRPALTRSWIGQDTRWNSRPLETGLFCHIDAERGPFNDKKVQRTHPEKGPTTYIFRIK